MILGLKIQVSIYNNHWKYGEKNYRIRLIYAEFGYRTNGKFQFCFKFG